MYRFSFYFLLFLIYSILGWMIECLVVGIEQKKFINRGFLIGPYCPIYGVSALFIILLLTPYAKDLFVLFILSAVLCSTVEYITSYLMEKIFKARWWDYSNKSFNINGRVCLVNSIGFGLLGCLLVSLVNPFVGDILHMIPENIVIVISLILLAIFIFDNIISLQIISKFTNIASTIMKDNTEEITEKIHEKIKSVVGKDSKLARRLINAFPNVKSKLPELKALYIEKKEKIKTKLNKEITIKSKKEKIKK